MSQRLILPINSAKLTASWKTDAYKNLFGHTHYGADMVSTQGGRTLYASGNGKVVAAGLDSVVGNVVVVQYDSAVNRATGKAQDVVFRYFHLDSIAVKAGQTVTKDTELGAYGSTGQLVTGPHLHLEADTDTYHPLYSPTVSISNLLKGRQAGANDSTMSNPLEWLYCKTSAPDNQTWTTANDEYIRDEDKSLPVQPEGEPEPAESIQGIDVSSHNGVIDWHAVKAAGKEFVMIKIGWAGWDGGITSNDGLDSRFYANVMGAMAAGLYVGVYVYSYCKTPLAARAAALEVLELMKPYKLVYPIAFDIEDTSDSGTRYDKMSKSENNEIVKAFLSTIQEAGYRGILYTYKSFAENYLNMLSLPYDVWIAQYANTCTYGDEYAIWQYKGDAVKDKAGNIIHPAGNCPGVTGPCDLNVSYRDYAAEYAPPAGGETEADELAALRDEVETLRRENALLNATLDEIAKLIKKYS